MNCFELLFDLLGVPMNELYLSVAESIDKNPEKSLRCFHKYGYLFSAYQLYVSWKTPLEDFMKIWDITSEIPLKSASSDGRLFLEGLIYGVEHNELSSYQSTIFVFDLWITPSCDIQKISLALAKVESLIFFC